MKIIHRKDYKYLGRWGRYHAFQLVKEKCDPEIILEVRVKVINDDLSVEYYQPISVYSDDETDFFRVRKSISEPGSVDLDLHNQNDNTDDQAFASYKRLATYARELYRSSAASGTVSRN